MKIKRFIFCWISSFSLLWLHNCHCFDLEALVADFVLETKRIIIEEYPHAFNPSLIRWNGSLLMSFRVIPDPKQTFNSWLGLVWLDENFQPSGKTYYLNMREENSEIPPRAEDGRLVIIDQTLYLVYTDNEEPVISKGGFRMYIAELQFDGAAFIIKNRECLSSFEGNDKDKREKNWVPFEYQKQLLLAYSITPHRILQPVLGTGHCETLISSESSMVWDWGELRGGTAALLDRNRYLAFFHSSKRMATLQSNGKEMTHYFIGAYTFSAAPPFNITQVSNQPIVGKDFYVSEEYKPYWKPIKVVFPCGFVSDENYIWLAYGKQDHEIWIAKLDKHKLYTSLSPVT